MKHEKTVKALIEKHRAIFPSYSLEQLNAIFAHCETYAGWLEELKAGPAEAEGVKGKAGAELARLEAETAHFESLYFRFFPSPEALFQTEIQLDEEGRESIRQRKVTPPYEGLFKWVKFRNAVYRDFILSLFPEAEGRKGKARKQAEELVFEGLFKKEHSASLVIEAMQEVADYPPPKQPGERHSNLEPLLNERGEAILFRSEKVAPLAALVEALFTEKMIKDGIKPEEAYRVICSRFSFETGSFRHARKTYIFQDYLAAFTEFFFRNDNRAE